MLATPRRARTLVQERSVASARETLVDGRTSPRQHAPVLQRPSSSILGDTRVESPAPKRGIASRAVALTALALTALACDSIPEARPADAPPRPPPPPEPIALPQPTGAPLPRGHFALAEAREVHSSFVLQPIPGGRAALAISQFAGERAAWARRLDAVGQGPLVRFVDRRVAGAFDREGSGTTFLTSDGTRVCLSNASWPGDGTTCVASTPAAMVPVGDRVALLELTTMRPPEPPGKPASKAPPKAPARSKPGKSSGRGKGSASKKKTTHAAPARRPSHPLVELSVRWVDERGAVDPEAKPTGLHFEAPLDGMTLADARARPPGIDILWYETAPKRRTRSALGSGRLMAASLRADGTLDFASRVAVLDADVEYGRLKDHHAPRLVGNDQATAYLGLGAKGECEVIRVRPALSHVTPPPAACAVAADRLAGQLDAAELTTFERILADEPRRAFGQPKTDVGLVAWAGDRAFYLHDGALRSATRDGGPPRDEPAPFPAHRARIAWGALTPDGEGLAFVDGGVVHVDARPATPAIAHVTAPAAVAPGTISAPELSLDRRRAVRIGSTWWRSRGDRLRLYPDVAPAPRPSPSVAQSATPVNVDPHPDTSVLVGGPSHGVSLDLGGGALRVAQMSPTGELTRLAVIAPSPVRPGFDACERAAGGAIVAGISAQNPAEVVAFTVDASGHAGPVHRTALPVRAGELAVRVVPLPSGGAWLLDADRRRVVWLGDDASLLGSAEWPAAESDAVCIDGRPMRRVVPGPAPGQFVNVPDSAEGACVLGDAVWGLDGHLRWLGATAVGLDSRADVVSLPLIPALSHVTPPPAVSSDTVSAPVAAVDPPRRCPADMVSIGGRYCVDRFESMIVDARTGEALSPDYPTTPNLLDFALGEWATARERTGNIHARAFPMPWISPSRLGDKPEPVAVARLGVRPNGYMTGLVAEAACTAAGKRLCSLDEFVMACRGEGDTLFPYGDTYEDGVCNVYREEHPAAMLHNNASVGHLDPRLNRVWSKGKPLLQKTGESLACRSKWGDDAVYDMVGNLDEWVNEGAGAFAGGFYARSTRSGCEALVTAHPKSYLDYSTGVRCCRD
ncbi:Cell division protein FtsK [Minicystis rosea]|nr:Cell division protein FtsK [Minicystis rosea]